MNILHFLIIRKQPYLIQQIPTCGIHQSGKYQRPASRPGFPPSSRRYNQNTVRNGFKPTHSLTHYSRHYTYSSFFFLKKAMYIQHDAVAMTIMAAPTPAPTIWPVV